MPEFGFDFSTFQPDGTVDLDPLFPLLSGSRVVLEVCCRRLMTPSGFFKRYPDLGFDLRARLGTRVTAVSKLQLQASIEAELVKDERVLRAKVEEFIELRRNEYRIRISVTLADGLFTLTLLASSALVLLLGATKG